MKAKLIVILIAVSIAASSLVGDQCASAGGTNSYTETAFSKATIDPTRTIITQAFDSNFGPEGEEYRKKLYKFFIQETEQVGGSTTKLFMYNISQELGTQTAIPPLVIQDNVEIVDADGPYIMLIQTDSESQRKLTLNGINPGPSGGTVRQFVSLDLESDQWKGFTFQKIFYYSPLYSSGSQPVTALILARKQNQAHVWSFFGVPIPNLDTKLRFKFTPQYSDSQIFVNEDFALQFKGGETFYYRSIEGADANQLFFSSALQANCGFNDDLIEYKALVGTNYAFIIRADNFDNPSKYITCSVASGGINGTLFEEVQNYRILTDEMTYQITIDSDSKRVKFRVFYNYRQQFEELALFSANAPIDDIIGDLNGASHIATSLISSPTSGPTTPGGPLTTYQVLTMFFYLYDQNQIKKYILIKSGQLSEFIKVFQIQLDETFKSELSEAASGSFEISANPTCICSSATITNFICFYGTDGCTFTVENQVVQCPDVSI